MGPAVLQQEVEEEILRSYECLYRLAYTYVKNPDDAMDVVQESVYKAIRNASGVRSRGAVKGWLCRIVVNTALDLLRTRSREVPVDQVPETGREDTYQDTDTLRALEAAARGGEFLSLEVRPSNLEALALYRGLGFREVGRRRRFYDDPVEDGLLLTKDLKKEEDPCCS